jgi:hypothetical protein
MTRTGFPTKKEIHAARMVRQTEVARLKKIQALRIHISKAEAKIRQLERERPPVEPRQATLNGWVQTQGGHTSCHGGVKYHTGQSQGHTALNGGVKYPTEILELHEPPVPQSNGQQTNPLIEWTVSEFKDPEVEVVDLEEEIASPSTEGGAYNDYLTLSLINNF